MQCEAITIFGDRCQIDQRRLRMLPTGAMVCGTHYRQHLPDVGGRKPPARPIVGDEPRVLNVRDLHGGVIPLGAVYVGRGRGSRWGNPFRIGADYTRAEAIAQYRRYIAAKIRTGELDIYELRGKNLVCWCSPKSCHAEVLLELANAGR